ncbi:MAG: hypothetical protein HY899_17245 [Deltaproteobacteria bacterium]|nr:hypothetical protein [Deltaproteobacteria bacterium]
MVSDPKCDAPLARETVEELEERIADRLRLGGGVIIGATVAFGLLDSLAALGQFHPLGRVQIALGLLGAASVALPRIRYIRRHATFAAAIVAVTLLSLIASGNVARQAGEAYFTLNVVCVLIAGGLFPWGLGPQLVVALAGLLCLIWVSSVGGGDAHAVSYNAANLVALGIGLGASVFLAHQHRSRSIAMLVEQHRLRRAQIEISGINSALEQRVRERTAELEEAITDLSAFAYSVSHDLRQPLRTVCGFAQLLEQDAGGELDVTGREFVARIRTAALRMDRIIDELLRLSRLGSQRLRREPVDLSELAASTSRALAASDPTRNVDWIIENRLTATGDPGLIAVLLDNLLGNAWKFTAASTRPRIEFGAEHDLEGDQVFFVRDNGCGFDEGEAGGIFRPFTRLANTDGIDGFGVGLATAQRIVHRHGGHLQANAQPGAGATFRFTLPANHRA